jgi:hypothetical protein
VTLEIEATFQHFGNTIIRFRVDGEFDKTSLPNPLILTYDISMQGQHISQIIIVHNKADVS